MTPEPTETTSTASGKKLDGLIRSDNHITPEEHRAILQKAAEYPGVRKALAEGSTVYAELVEGVKAGELYDRASSPGSADS